MSDGVGLVQFMIVVGEIARGASVPSVMPVWQRELLSARDPPRVTCTHNEYEQVLDTKGTIIPLDDMAHQSFFFGSPEIASLRRFVPPHLLSKYSTFDLLTACLWRCRTIALQPDPEEVMRMMCIVNARKKFNPPLPVGYYGNTFAFPAALATAGSICKNPLAYALEPVMKAKSDATEEYMRLVMDLMVIRGRPYFTVVRSYIVSNVTRAGFGEVDFGWGKPVYGGPTKGVVEAMGVASLCIPYKNKRGRNGILVPICLPGPAMGRFVKELNSMLKDNDDGQSIPHPSHHTFIASGL